MRRLQGIGVSPGVVSGRAVILNQRARVLRYRVPAGRVARELERLEQGRRRTRDQLRDIQASLTARRGPELASIFDAQVLMLDDPLLVPRAAALIREQHVNAEWAVQNAFDEFSAVFDEIVDPYLRERKGDVADLVGRLRMNVRQGFRTPRDLLQEVDEASILVADELTPSLAAQVDWSKVRGFATDAGSRTYHTAILARSLEVPAIVGLHEASRVIQPGQLLVLDGSSSELIVDPTDAVLARATRAAADHHPSHAPEAERGRPATTADGVHIRLEANIEFPDDLASVRYAGAEGIGLYRSEFLLTDQTASLDEDAQCAVYRGLLEGMAPGPVTVRTFDVDQERLARHGDRTAFGQDWLHNGERESREGLRGLRLSLTQPDLFRTQLRALLRAARYGRLRVLFPFVSSVEQVRAARQIVSSVEADLRRAGEKVPDVPIGVMIEIPAAAYAADVLAREVDFFTIGTNDLIQYCLAVDRVDERVSQLYQPLHPAVLRVIRMTRRAAERQGIPVSLCGEMAADPALLTLLVGLGLVEFSMTPGAIPVAKRVLAEVRRDEMHALARRVLRMATIADIERELLAVLGRLAV